MHIRCARFHFERFIVISDEFIEETIVETDYANSPSARSEVMIVSLLVGKPCLRWHRKRFGKAGGFDEDGASTRIAFK